MDPVLIWSAAIILSGLFLTAGWHKLTAPAYYRDLIGTYLGLPPAPARLGGSLIAFTELSIGVLLLLPAFRIFAAWGAVGLLLVYSLLIAVSLLRGLDMDCGCSGPLARQHLSPWLLVRNAVLFMVAWGATQPVSDRGIGVGDYLVILCASITLMCIYLACEQLLSNRDKLALLRSR